MINIFKKLLLLFIPILLSSCSSMKKSVSLGIGSGIVAGATTGSAIGGNKAMITGAVSGAIISGAAAYFIHKALDNRDSQIRKKTLLNLDKFDVHTPGGSSSRLGPSLSKPVVDSYLVEEQVRGNKLIESHRVWIIEENSNWLPRNNIKKKKGSK